jgi:glycosyltransferase involved in cell wall biosynthesis
MPKISVFIPIGKERPTLKETIDSIKTQAYEDYEIVISQDNKGLAHNLNSAKNKCTGDLIVFLADDDILLPGALWEIDREFNDNESLGIAVRKYYWFKDNPEISLRRTKQNKFKLHDLVMLTGQLSGIAVKRELLNHEFKEMRFVEFSSGVLPIIRDHDSMIIDKNIVAVRINSSDSVNKEVYTQSPTANWRKVIYDTFIGNDNLIEHLETHLGNNHIGLIQVRCYGSYKQTLREIGQLYLMNPFNIFNPKFYIYSLTVLIIPAKILIKLKNTFIYYISKRMCK